MEQDRMPRLMIGSDLLVLSGHDFAPLFGADAHFDERPPDILLDNIGTVRGRRVDCRLIHKVLEICSRKTGRRLGDLSEVNIIPDRLVPDMYFEDLLPSAHIGHSHTYLAVEASRS